MTTHSATETIALLVSSPNQPERWITRQSTSAARAAAEATKEGYRVLKVERETASKSSSGKPARRRRTGGQRFDLLLFSQELLALLNAGLNLLEAVETQHQKAVSDDEQRVIGLLIDSLKRGERFSDALSSQSEIFPSIFVAGIRAAEKTGNLSHSLARYIAYQQQFDLLRQKVIAASTYPLMLLCVGAAVVLFLLGFVVPRFAAVYDSSGRDLPVLSSALLVIGRFVHDNTILVLTSVFLISMAIGFLIRAGKLWPILGNWISKSPLTSDYAALYRFGRLYRALGVLLSSGIPLAEALTMVRDLMGPAGVESVTQIRSRVAQGQSLSFALESEKLSTPVAQSLIRVGERSGQLAEMLERAAQFHDHELSRWMDRVTRLIEPALMLLIGLVIGCVVVLMYLPIFDLAGSFR